MSERTKQFLESLFNQWYAIIFLVLCVTSCSEKKEESSIHKIGKYLYQDKGGTIHVWDNCIKLWGGDEHNHGVKRIPSEGFDPKLLDNTCSFCIKDDTYEKLEQMKGEMRSNTDSTDWSQYIAK